MIGAAIVIAATLATYIARRLTRIDGRLDKLNGQVARNTEFRHSSQEGEADRKVEAALLVERLDTLTERVTTEVIPSLNRLESDFQAQR
jgi:hypothetical protein